MAVRITVTLAVIVAVACAKPPPTFDDVPPAEDLYAEGQKILNGGTWLWILPRVKYTEAVEVFQSIIDNYPYSEYAILAELAIADSYFEEEKYEEALSYYRDFSDLHLQNEKVPYAIYRSALCHARRVESPNRDQTATRQAVNEIRDVPLARRGKPLQDRPQSLKETISDVLAQSTAVVGDVEE